LKVILDAIIGPDNFKNEIVWKRTTTHSDSRTWSRVSDTILFYTVGKKFTWNIPRERHSDEYKADKYRNDDNDGRGVYMLDNMTSPNPRPNMMYDWRGFPYPEKGWRYSKETMARLDSEGRIWYPTSEDGSLDTARRPRLKRYLSEQPGGVMGNVWTDISPVNSQARERIGYPTQKPIALLDRIIKASTNEGDVILDPFCGCGTTIEAAERAKREWVGIDVAIHAVKVIEARLEDQFGKTVKYGIEGIPRDFESAKRLAKDDKYQFQWWANYLFNPHAIREQKKGADRGIDGELYFPNGPGRPWGRMLTSVKGGENVGPAMVREFGRVLEREKAELGLFICLSPPTREMVRDASSLGYGDTVHGDIPRLQIVAIEDWFKGIFPKLPPLEHLPSAAFATSRRRVSLAAKRPDPDQPELPLSFVGGKGTKEGVVHLNPQMVRATAAA
jgi:site-specific DNA-methyltransferase (adenine-specific)